MKKTLKTGHEKEAIIAEYLLGELTYRQLGLKHGIDFRIIHSWVTKFKGKPVINQKAKIEQYCFFCIKAKSDFLKNEKLNITSMLTIFAPLFYYDGKKS